MNSKQRNETDSFSKTGELLKETNDNKPMSVSL